MKPKTRGNAEFAHAHRRRASARTFDRVSLLAWPFGWHSISIVEKAQSIEIMAQGVVENMIILLWSCTVGLVLVLPVLLFMRKSWFPDDKQLQQAKNPVGAALRGLLRDSSSTRHVPLQPNPSESSQVKT